MNAVALTMRATTPSLVHALHDGFAATPASPHLHATLPTLKPNVQTLEMHVDGRDAGAMAVPSEGG